MVKPNEDGSRLRHMPALDGIRAFAVLAVISFHGGISWMPGGFYGVDAFFVLSGFLITSLLVKEWASTGSVSLRRFWSRRARRLLPALFLMIAVVGLLGRVWPATLATPNMVPDTLATLGYVANWHLALDHASYFSVSSHPSPLLHTWSLAVEEQFYLLWPLVVLAVLRGRHRGAHSRGAGDRGARDEAGGPGLVEARRRRLLWLLALAVVGAIASALWMSVIATGTDPTRAYYGSDTRAQALLVGAALAIAVRLWGPVRRGWPSRAVALLGLGGAAGAAAVWVLVPETSPVAFHGGFMAVSLSCAAVILCASQLPRSVLGRTLSLRPLRFLGRISYGMYLWYWPALLVMTGERTHLHGYVLFLARVAAVTAVASASYVLVEQPIRRGVFKSWRGAVAIPAGAAVAATAVLSAALVPSLAPVAASASAPARVTALASRPGARPRAPVKVLLVGDSMAGSLGVGMVALGAQYGAEVVNEGSPGCSLGMYGMFSLWGQTVPPGPPCALDDPSALLAQWKSWVDSFNPDVVVYLARGDLFNQQLASGWANVGQPGFDSWLAGRFEQAVGVLGSRGARVVMMTSPYYDSGEQPSGTGWPEDSPARVLADNALISQVAHGDPAAVSVIGLGSLLSPDGTFTSTIDGVEARCQDGVHVTVAGGEWVARQVLPRLASLGSAHQTESPGGSWPAPLPPNPPRWWSPSSCGSLGSLP